MKFTLSWLKDHLDTNADLKLISETLTSIGLEVESVQDKSETLKDFKVAHIVEAKQHPNADKLKLCTVDNGKEKLQIVCGAANARAGLKVVLAEIGTFIPGSNFTIKKTNIRGVESNGMLCSAEELSLEGDSEGIIELPENAKIGERIANILGLDDPIIEIAITPNRADCLGVRGIARDLASAGIGKLKEYKINKISGSYKSPITVNITEKSCPLFVGRYFKNIKNTESPDWMKKRLRTIGLKPISALVDITNYICFEFGRPLHVYDAKKLNGNLSVKMVKNGEKITALNDKEYTLDSEILVISDEKSPVAIAGVIGGKISACEEKTTDVFLEVALFEPFSVAKSGRKLQINTDSRYRFERGVDRKFLFDAAEIASKYILEFCGGEASELAIVGKEPDTTKIIQFNPDKIKNLGGIEVKEEKVTSILNSLGFKINKSQEIFEIEVPSWRSDVNNQADIVEEVIRINGYNNLPSIEIPKVSYVAKPAVSQKNKFIYDLRRTLVAERGLYEVITFSFINSKDASYFSDIDKKLKLSNPISAELDIMRTSIIPGLLNIYKNNSNRGYENTGVFEIGPEFSYNLPERQRLVASGIRTGKNFEENIYKDSREVDFYDVKADVFSCLSLILQPEKIQLNKNTPKYYHPGKSANIMLGKSTIAVFGEIHPNILKHFDIKGSVVAFEIYIDAVPLPKQKNTSTRSKLEIYNFQSVERDFAFIVDNKIPANDLIKEVYKCNKDLIDDVRVFDIYTGKGIEQGKKSVALKIKLQPKDKTLQEKEINDLSEQIISSVKLSFGGTIRS